MSLIYYYFLSPGGQSRTHSHEIFHYISQRGNAKTVHFTTDQATDVIQPDVVQACTTWFSSLLTLFHVFFVNFRLHVDVTGSPFGVPTYKCYSLKTSDNGSDKITPWM